MVLISYVLGELAEKDRLRALEICWNAAGTLLLIVEPGTPVGAAIRGSAALGARTAEDQLVKALWRLTFDRALDASG